MKTIVKVQLSLHTNEDRPQMLIYNRDSEHWFQGDAIASVVKAMGGEYKKYFHAEVPKDSSYIDLLSEAPEQSW